MIDDPEDEAFNEIERQAQQRKEAVRVAMRGVEENKWIETNNFICTLLRQAHDALALSSLPPRRTWVGLTNEEIELIYGVIIKIRKKDIMPVEQKQFAKTLELLLRKKNT